MLRFNEEIKQKLKEAMKKESTDEMADALCEMIEEQANEKSEKVLQDALKQNDESILRARGARMLTSAEKEYYEKVVNAMKSPDYKQAIEDIVMPETIIEDVFSEIENEHPLLSRLDIKVVPAKVRMIFGVSDDNKATWGKLTDKITTEISGSFEEIDIYQMKLSAYIPLPESMLDLGPTYLDRFVRTLLYDAIANGIEDAVINNLKSDGGPIGMQADLTQGQTSTGVTTYTAKTAIRVTDWTPKGLAEVIKAMTRGRSNKPRRINGLFMVVSPTDYYSIVKPAICVQTPAGDWVDKSPYPIDIIQSVYCPTGKAIMGLNGKFMLGIGTNQAGKLEYSDEFAFLDDNRTYKIKLYGNGQPKDNKAFQVLDISGLQEYTSKVSVKGTVTTKAEAAE